MILINGQIIESLPVTDRAVHYGDGLFETILVQDGVPQLWDRHLVRLQHSCQRLALNFDEAALMRDLSTVLSNGSSGVLKIIISRGSGGRGYAPPHNPHFTRIVQLHPLPPGNELKARQGVSVIRCHHPLSVNPALAGLKHLNRLDQVMGSMELRDHDEGLMCDPDGHLIEGIRSNLFLVGDRGIVTPDLSRAGVAGIMRALLIELFHSHDIAVEVRQVGRDDILCAKGLFVCNSVFGIWPVVRLNWNTGEGDDSMTFDIDDHTRQAQAWLREVF